MCIIAIKPKGMPTPKDATLTEMFTRNPNGGGIAYTTDKGVKVIKGLMDKKSFLNACHKIPTDAVAIIHTRITTSGGTRAEITHPYKLTNNYKEMKQTNATIQGNNYVVAHNGIFSEFGNQLDINDTMEFIATYLQPLKELAHANDKSILSETLDPIITKLVSGSKLVILSTDGTYKKYGNGWIYDNGIYYSNTTYKPYQPLTYNPTNYILRYTTDGRPYYETKNKGATYYDYLDEDDLDYWEQYYCTGKYAPKKTTKQQSTNKPKTEE